MSDMYLWVVGVPVFLMLLVLVLERLESAVVAPGNRADQINALVEHAEPDEVERFVATMLAPTIDARS